MDRCWCELVDGEEMKLRVGVLLGLELGFLGVFCSAAATAIDCHIDRQSKAEFFFCFNSVNKCHVCMRSTWTELACFYSHEALNASLLGCLKATTPRKRRVDAPDDDARRDVDASSWELELLR